MIIVTPQTINMHCNPRRLRKTLHAMWNHLTAQISNFLSLQAQLYNAERTVGQVHHGAGERFIERGIGGSETCETGGDAEGVFKGAAESDADIFSGVVVVDYGEGVVSNGISSGCILCYTKNQREISIQIPLILSSALSQ